MPAATEAAKEAREASAEALKGAQAAVRRYLDESVAMNNTYFNAWTNSAQATMRTAFDWQNANFQAWRTLVDASLQANRNWFEQMVDLMRRNQDVTSRLMAASFGLAESTFPRPRQERERER